MRSGSAPSSSRSADRRPASVGAVIRHAEPPCTPRGYAAGVECGGSAQVLGEEGPDHYHSGGGSGGGCTWSGATFQEA